MVIISYDVDRIVSNQARRSKDGGVFLSDPSREHDQVPSSQEYSRTHKYPLADACPEHWTWNYFDRSHEVRLYGDRMEIAHFHPNWSNGTAGVRGTKPFDTGCHYWEIEISQRVFGTSMMIGIGTCRARLHVDAFVNMLGEDDQGWGLSHKGLLWHGGNCSPYATSFEENKPTTLGMLLDCNRGTLAYYKDGVCLGIAFDNIPVNTSLYPIICSTAAKTQMTLGVTLRSFFDLQDRCRSIITNNIRRGNDVEQLPLPTRIQDFIKEGML